MARSLEPREEKAEELAHTRLMHLTPGAETSPGKSRRKDSDMILCGVIWLHAPAVYMIVYISYIRDCDGKNELSLLKQLHVKTSAVYCVFRTQ